jgi:16S rRNA (guanine966-N2)-methyltransferase
MRIISGTLRGRRLHSPKGTDKTRPLPDRVRTALFNMLKGHFEGQTFFDAFAGTGSFGIEALSRGAERCVFVERDKEVARILTQNIEEFGLGDRAEVFQGDALGAGALSRCPSPVHVALFDPPYPLMEDRGQRSRVIEQFARVIERLDPEGFAVIRTPWPAVDIEEEETDETDEEGEPIVRRHRRDIDLRVPGAKGPETHVYGSTAVHWYMKR